MLAPLVRFVLVDMTDASGILEAISQVSWTMPVPVQPLVHQEAAFTNGALLSKLRLSHDIVLETHWYKNSEDLGLSLPQECFAPAEARVQALRDIGNPLSPQRSPQCRPTFC
jgi:hypothetical protein